MYKKYLYLLFGAMASANFDSALELIANAHAKTEWYQNAEQIKKHASYSVEMKYRLVVALGCVYVYEDGMDAASWSKAFKEFYDVAKLGEEVAKYPRRFESLDLIFKLLSNPEDSGASLVDCLKRSRRDATISVLNWAFDNEKTGNSNPQIAAEHAFLALAFEDGSVTIESKRTAVAKPLEKKSFFSALSCCKGSDVKESKPGTVPASVCCYGPREWMSSSTCCKMPNCKSSEPTIKIAEASNVCQEGCADREIVSKVHPRSRSFLF